MIYDILPVNNYKGNNNSKKFDFDFYIDNESQIVVYLYDKDDIKHKLKLNVDYSINEVKNKNGSYITFPLSGSNYGVLSEKERISLELTLPKSQETQYNNSSLLNLEALEYSLDYLTRLIQILARKSELCIKTEEGSDIGPDDFLQNIKTYVKNANNSEINASKKAQESLNSANLAKDWAIKTNGKINNIDYSSKYYAQKANDAAKKAENETYKVLHPIDTINQCKALETVSISSFSDAYNNIKAYAHSTFDLSKFTLAGSPAFSDDGVVSGFSADDYITVPVIKFSTAKTWEINFSFMASEISQASDDSNGGNAIFGKESRIRVNIQPSGQMNFLMAGESLSWAGHQSSGKTIKTNILYFAKAYFDGTSYKLDLSQDGNTFTNYVAYNNTNTIFDTDFAIGMNLGYLAGNSQDFKGSVDLKHFSIKLDGIEVFSANKTGLDIIKEDNYTVVGSPVISEDRIASGFSGDNFFRTKSISLAGAWKIQMKARFDDVSSVVSQLLVLNSFNRIILNPNKTIYIYASNESQTGKWVNFNKIVLSENKDYLLTFEYDGNSTYSFTLTDIESGKEQKQSAQLDSKIHQSAAQWAFALNLQGRIDLNSFKVYVDGKLIYQPCLKIPYTLSKTGSKIVDVSCRNRVQDMYEQFGYAPYYTIDEKNKTFTLPMGEIYGMIEKTRSNLDDIIRPIGKPIISMNNDTLKFDEIWLEGAKVLKSTYPKLAQIYGDTYAPSDAQDKDTYLYLPDFRNRTIWGSPDNTYGYIEAGLPNITGSFGTASQQQFWSPQGAFTIGLNYTGNGSDYTENNYVNFDASLANNIYGNSETVQPPSVKVRWKTRFK